MEKNISNLKTKFTFYKEKLLSIKSLLNQSEKYKEIITSLNSIDTEETKFYLNFFFFKNLTKYIPTNINNISEEKEYNNFFKIMNNNNINNINDIFIQYIFFLYIELIRNIYYTDLKINISELNKISFLLKESFDILFYLYKIEIFEAQNIFNILEFFFFLIRSNFDIKYDTNNFDFLYEIKNFILFNNFFNFLGKIGELIINKSNTKEKKTEALETVDEKYKKEINLFFNFLENFKNDTEINYRINKSILLNNDFIGNFIEKKILVKINIKILDKYKSDYKNQLINFYSNFTKFNYNESKILSKIINSLKNSFINLSDFIYNKNTILKNLFIQGFYTKLLKKNIFLDENYFNNKNIYPPVYDTFFFNSYDSQISLSIENKTIFLENCCLFFSFNLEPKNNNNIYPLFIILNNKKEILFYLYINKSNINNNEYFLEINDNNNNNIKIKENKIIPGITYYINIIFISTKIFFNSYNGSKIYSEEINTVHKKSDNYTLIFGKKEKSFFSGYIGPIIAVKILSSVKKDEIMNLTKAIFELNIYYQYFIFLKKNSNFFFENLYRFQSDDILNTSKKKFEKFNFECLLYFTPDIIKRIKNNLKLPEIDDISTMQKDFNINKINITLIKHEFSNNNFINENGLNYICLLYEYIYQFLCNEEKYCDKITFEELCLIDKIIVSIIKKTLYIIEKYFYELDVLKLNKSFKQLYMNLFECLKLISKNYYIIDDIIENLFNITLIYRNLMTDSPLKDKKDKKKSDDDTNYLKKIISGFMYGIIDFLLTPQLYDFNNSKTLIILLDKLKSYFHSGFDEKNLILINRHFYLKFLGLAVGLSNFFDASEVSTSDKKIVKEYYFMILEKFFQKKLEKGGNILNIKIIFRFINDNLDTNYKINLVFFELIEKLIGDNPDEYFSDDKNNEQIKILLNFVEKFSISENNNLYESIKIKNNRKNFLNKMMKNIMKIIFTKKRINENQKIIEDFKKIIIEIDLTGELIEIITKQIENIIENSLGIHKNKSHENKKKENKGQEIKKDDNYNNISLSNFYEVIFNLILYFLEYPINNSNINNIKDIDSYEEKIFDLLQQIQLLVKSNHDNDKKVNDYNSNNNDDNYNHRFNINSIYCIINLLKFYSNILFKRLYPEKYIKEFISVCEIIIDCGLIYSDIFIKLENAKIYKTILEIILDDCLNYLIYSSKHFYDPLDVENINGIRNENIIKEQEMIYNFLMRLFPKLSDENGKKKFSIFYLNDYFNYLAEKEKKEKKNKKKNNKDNNNSLDNSNEFIEYKNIFNLLSRENKFEFSFLIYFLIKLWGYNNLLTKINDQISQKSPNLIEILKYWETFALLNETIQIIKEEYDSLYNQNKNIFKSKKKNNHINLDYYDEVKKRLEYNSKKISGSAQADNYILKVLLNNENFNVYEMINFDSKKVNKSSTLNNDRICASSSKILSNLYRINQEEIEPKTPQIKTKFNINTSSSPTPFSLGEEKNLINDEDSLTNNTNVEDTILHLEEDNDNDYEASSSEFGTDVRTEKNDKNDNIETNTILPKIIRNRIKQKTLNLSNNIFSPLILDKRRKTNEIKTIYSDCALDKYQEKENFDINYNIYNKIKNEDDIPYVNFFEEPDEYYLKNSKKELMNTIFSIYFIEPFFDSFNFKFMKKIYTQSFTNINTNTKKLNFPSKFKHYSNGLEPCLFLKPFQLLFNDKTFGVTHEYFYNYIKEKKIKLKSEKIFLYKKKLSELNIENKMIKKCELIKFNKNYYGDIICSHSCNFIIFEEKDFEFYDENIIKTDSQNLNDLFTLSVISKQPKNPKLNLKIKSVIKNSFYNENYRQKKKLIILFQEIEEIIEKKFLHLWQSLEIFLKNGKSYFFNFLTNDNYDQIITLFKNNPYTKNKIYKKDFLKENKIITKEWCEGHLSTYEYLLYVNKYGTRTFNDTNQYYIFPWVQVYDNDKQEKEIRNMNYPMAAQSERNREFSMNKYLDDEESGIQHKSHYGTHYSTSAYVYFYLMRVEPFTALLVKLQGYKQEVPDRMFSTIEEILIIFNSLRDNRELIPEFFNEIEILLNLNCVDFGMKKNGNRIDDFCLDFNILDSEEKYNYDSTLSKFVKFTIKNKKLLNGKKVSKEINNWIDIIFGVEQLPNDDKARKKSLNIYYKESYEQNLNLNGKMKKYMKKNFEKKKIINKILSKINIMISFGQTPHQIFQDNHPKLKEKINNKEDDFELELNNVLWNRCIKLINELNPIFFEMNNNGKMILIDNNNKFELIKNTLYDQKESEKYQFNKYGSNKILSNIEFFEKIEYTYKDTKINTFYIIKQKYSIALFEDKIEYDNIVSLSDALSKDNHDNQTDKECSKDKENIKNNNIHPEYTAEITDNNFNLYDINYINKIKYLKNKKGKKHKDSLFIFITCRHLDNSFKIYPISIAKSFKKDIKPFSYICESFVSCVNIISYNKFIIGLKNGKMMIFSIEKNSSNNDLSIYLNKQIKGHKSNINMIEINQRLGLILSGGDDHFLFIRKLYDMELLIPIKFKKKYIITMAKISPMNFLYVICFHKFKKKSVIFGYTLNGILFAKSRYAYYDTLDFTKTGNIVTWTNKKKIQVLLSNDLQEKSYNKNDKIEKKKFEGMKSKISNASWIKYDFFDNKYLGENARIITYTTTENANNVIKTYDVSDISYFD